MTGRYVNRREASELLRNRYGIRVAPATLAKWASISSDGPPMTRFGSRGVLYEVETLIHWAESKLSAPRRSTSDKGELAQ